MKTTEINPLTALQLCERMMVDCIPKLMRQKVSVIDPKSSAREQSGRVLDVAVTSSQIYVDVEINQRSKRFSISQLTSEERLQ